MRINKFVRSLLKTAVYMVDQAADQVDRASDRAAQFADDARSVIHPAGDSTLRNVLSFAAGIGVGVTAGMLLAPSSGAELRSSISSKVQDIGGRVKGRAENLATGTDLR